ncbi:MAG: FABP family protein [Halobacteriovoraceae bacterium]|jgi:hypothetical protein|nr:FABP family protein [Halobacteriovoraceae bacterium]MBT5093403.1 FABP family protein [Halobacteriovoraceae bacterium]
MSNEKYGPLAFLIGKWDSVENKGENRAPDPQRKVENTKFRQEMVFEPIGDVNNHEQKLYALRYSTMAWEEGSAGPFHEEVGYWIWDLENQQVMKSFIVPRGISINAGGTVAHNSSNFKVAAELGSNTYGLCSNLFLNEEFKTVHYEIAINKIDENTFSYEEDSQIKIKGQDEIFHHTEKNTLKRV